MEKDDLNIGDKWYVRLPGRVSLSAVEITDITELTVEVRTDGVLYRTPPSRYVFEELEFIEAY